MMKLNRLLTIIMLALCIAVCLTGCSKETPDGRWRITDHTAIGDGDVEDANGVIITYDFKEGGAFAFGLHMGETSEYVDGSWVVDDDVLSITMDGDTVSYEYEIEDDVLTLTETTEAEPAVLKLERY